MHYDPRWRQEFEQTRSNILHSCEGWVTDVAHIGSTAISGLVARPIVDVVASVENLAAVDEAIQRLRGLNFSVARDPAWADEVKLLAKPRHGEPTHHVYLASADSAFRRRVLTLRDWLRSNAEEAVRFEEGKVELWKRSEGDPARYAQAKADLFASLEAKIP
ncbi:GrpB family protein [Candidatus Laterigemmans baculatus]|uniref:GrpB family protein n=1 Tax=Candidatus Laterigemmans baculatus TaxID=2770505 RepID=UPI0013DA25A3|nr:GrpB family protein [Candidatus Laterigemmans baculatus]